MTKNELFAMNKNQLSIVDLSVKSTNVYCPNCTDCSYCTDCTGIKNGKNLKYIAYGVQLTKEEFEEFVKKS